jgi:phosphotriesterase-related protein
MASDGEIKLEEHVNTMGKITTVLGIIESNNLGIVLSHEHIFIDMRSFYIEPDEAKAKEIGKQPVCWQNLSWVRSHRQSNIDNLTPFDLETAIKEVSRFKSVGGDSIVEQTPNNMGRDPLKLAHVAKATGVNIIMGTGYYREMFTVWDRKSGKWNSGKVDAYPDQYVRTANEKDITAEFINDLTIGVGDTGIRAGIIGEIGCSWPLTKNEKKVLRASVAAQERTGALITIHPDFREESPLEILDYLSALGADLSRIVICHLSISVEFHETRLKLAKMGCYLEWDLFGWEGVYPQQPTSLDIPSDQGCIRQIVKLIDEGYLKQILISHDICAKIRICRYGGSGYGHLIETVIPVMKQKGITEEQIHTITVENPRRALVFS